MSAQDALCVQSYVGDSKFVTLVIEGFWQYTLWENGSVGCLLVSKFIFWHNVILWFTYKRLISEMSQLRRAQPDHWLPWKPEKCMDKVLSLFLLFALINVISFQVSNAVVDQMMVFWVSPSCTLEHVTATWCRDLKVDHQLIFHNSLLWILPTAMLLEDPWFRPKRETKYWVRWTNICRLPEVPCIEFQHRDSLNNMKMSAERVFLCVGYY